MPEPKTLPLGRIVVIATINDGIFKGDFIEDKTPLSTKYKHESKRYECTFTRISQTHISVKISIQQDEAAQLAEATKKQKEHIAELQRRLDLITLEQTEFEKGIATEEVYADAVENKGVNYITSMRDKALLKLELDKLNKNITCEAQTHMYEGVCAIGTRYNAEDLFIHTSYLDYDFEWKYEIQTQVKQFATLPTKSELKVGTRVLAIYQKSTETFKATIKSVNKNGTYALQFDDGDSEMEAPLKNIISVI